jgi:hypothetical protein
MKNDVSQEEDFMFHKAGAVKGKRTICDFEARIIRSTIMYGHRRRVCRTISGPCSLYKT